MWCPAYVKWYIVFCVQEEVDTVNQGSTHEYDQSCGLKPIGLAIISKCRMVHN